MHELEYFNLNWLSKAFTEARRPGRHFYYDVRSASFFYAVASATYGAAELYDTLDLEIAGERYKELMIRLGLDNEETSGIIELPRFKEEEKKMIQCNFLRPYDGHQNAYEYNKAVEHQTDAEGFILDDVMVAGESDLLPQLWEQYKLSFVKNCALQFARAVGIELNLSQ